MTFDCITQDKNLWAVRYDGDSDNILYRLFDQWDDAEWLRTFFKEHFNDLVGYFKVTSINQAVLDTMEDRDTLWNASCWTSARTTTWMHSSSRLKISAHLKCCLARRKPVPGARSGIRPGFAFMPSNWIRVCISSREVLSNSPSIWTKGNIHAVNCKIWKKCEPS